MRWNRFVLVVAVFSAAACGFAQETPAPRVLRAEPTQDAQKKEKPVYDEAADAKQQIAAAIAKAAKENRRVLIQWGGNWCPWCLKLHELFKKNAEIARTLQYEYDVVHVDAGKPAGKNVDLATSYGADLKKSGFPYLTILSADGKPLANQDTAAFEVDGKNVAAGHDSKKVLEFLKAHQAEYRKATDVFAAGLAEARKSDKSVFVHFGAPWCGWCGRMEAWMAREDVAALLAKDYVDVKIDIDRTIGGKELLAKYATTDKVGIPWYAIVDAEGKALADSNEKPGDPNSNIGFPAKDAEIAHFAQMLKKTAKKLTAAELEKIRASLAKKAE
ncbi:MAG: thioredoxin family protein [Planctomycetes bacterium]|nr:thioredoxin family protein [Planctomycetota bacterium]